MRQTETHTRADGIFFRSVRAKPRLRHAVDKDKQQYTHNDNDDAYYRILPKLNRFGGVTLLHYSNARSRFSRVAAATQLRAFCVLLYKR